MLLLTEQNDKCNARVQVSDGMLMKYLIERIELN